MALNALCEMLAFRLGICICITVDVYLAVPKYTNPKITTIAFVRNIAFRGKSNRWLTRAKLYKLVMHSSYGSENYTHKLPKGRPPCLAKAAVNLADAVTTSAAENQTMAKMTTVIPTAPQLEPVAW